MLPTFDFWNTVKFACRRLYVFVKLPIAIYALKCAAIATIITLLTSFLVDSLANFVHWPFLSEFVDDMLSNFADQYTNFGHNFCYIFNLSSVVYELKTMAKSFALFFVALGSFWLSAAVILRTFSAQKALNDSISELIKQNAQ